MCMSHKVSQVHLQSKFNALLQTCDTVLQCLITDCNEQFRPNCKKMYNVLT